MVRHAHKHTRPRTALFHTRWYAECRVPAPNAIQAVTLDFYNTLVYHRAGPGRGAMLMEYLHRHGLQSDPWEHKVLYDVFENHHTEYSPRQSEPGRREYKERIAARAFRRLNIRAPDGAAVEHAGGIWEVLGPSSLAVFPEVVEVLASLRDAGYPVAIVSNWQCGLRHFCAELGLDVDPVLASAEVGSAKPDTAIFDEACRRLGTAPASVLHAGDSVIDDYQGARGAGMSAVVVRRDGAPSDADFPSVTDLRGVLEIVGQKTA